MRIGVPQETLAGETRVASTPEVVKKLVAKGLTVLVERGAGLAAHFPDAEFEQAGAQLCDRAGALDADIVLRVRRSAGDDVAAQQACQDQWANNLEDRFSVTVTPEP